MAILIGVDIYDHSLEAIVSSCDNGYIWWPEPYGRDARG